MPRKSVDSPRNPYKLREWRRAFGKTYDEVAAALGMSGQNYGKIERGQVTLQPFHLTPLADFYGAAPEDLHHEPGDGTGRWGTSGPRSRPGVAEGDEAQNEGGFVPIIGTVGADPDGRIIRTAGQRSNDTAPLPTGGTTRSVALEVDGHSMRGIADDGALVYFEDQRNPPTPDMIGDVVVVQIASGPEDSDDEAVLVKRLLRGSEPGLYDLESIAGPRVENVRIRWAAEIITIVPPKQARRLIRRGIA